MNNIDLNLIKIKQNIAKKDYFKKYYIEHKEIYTQKNIDRKLIFFNCEICNCKCVLKCKASHNRTKKHLRNNEIHSYDIIKPIINIDFNDLI